jgi:hypothetical protein
MRHLSALDMGYGMAVECGDKLDNSRLQSSLGTTGLGLDARLCNNCNSSAIYMRAVNSFF